MAALFGRKPTAPLELTLWRGLHPQFAGSSTANGGEPRKVKLLDPVSNQVVIWQAFKDPASGDPYYYNTTTQRTQWGVSDRVANVRQGCC